MRTSLKAVWCGLLAMAACVMLGSAAQVALAEGEAAAAAEKVTYDDHVKPIFRQHCFTCHGSEKAESDLKLDTYSTAMRGGASGEVVLGGDPDSSRLWGLISHAEEPKMPPNQDKLPDAELAIIKKWIELGALENAGSTAKKSNKPKLQMSVAGGAGKPEGPVAMPEGISRQVTVYTPKPGAATAIAASPWAPLVAVASQKQVLLYHSDTSELLGVLPFPEGTPYVLRFSRSGALLLAGGGRGGQSGKVVVFDVKTGARVVEVGDELDTVLAADINEDHTRIALGGPRRMVRVYNVADGALVHEIKKHTEWITSIEFSPDGVLLATGDRNGGMFVWEAETAREYLDLRGHTAAITGVSWRDDSNVLATGSEDGTIKLWEMEAGAQVKSWNAHGGVESVVFAHDGRLASVGRDRLPKVWNADGSEAKSFEALPDVGLSVAFAHDGARIAAGDLSGEVRLLDVAGGQLLAKVPTNPPPLDILAAQKVEEAARAKQAAEAALAAKNTAAADAAAKLQSLTDKQKALADATAQLEALKAAVAQAETDKAAADKALADQDAATQQAAATADAAQKAADKAQADAAAAAPPAQAQAPAAAEPATSG